MGRGKEAASTSCEHAGDRRGDAVERSVSCGRSVLVPKKKWKQRSQSGHISSEHQCPWRVGEPASRRSEQHAQRCGAASAAAGPGRRCVAWTPTQYPRQGSAPCYTATNDRRTGRPLRCLADASQTPRRCPGAEARGWPAVGRERHNERPLQQNTPVSPPAYASPGRRAIPSAVLAPLPEQAISFVPRPNLGQLQPALAMLTLMKPRHFEPGASSAHLSQI